LGFLVFDVLSDHLCVEANGIYAVPSRPEVITPIGLLLQFAKLVQYPNRRSTFDGSNILGNRQLRRHHPEQVDMIDPNIQFDNLTPKPFREGSYAIFNLLGDLVGENSVPVLWYPYYMILAVPYRL
jgi:hypothetical protein